MSDGAATAHDVDAARVAHTARLKANRAAWADAGWVGHCPHCEGAVAAPTVDLDECRTPTPPRYAHHAACARKVWPTERRPFAGHSTPPGLNELDKWTR